MRVFDTMEDYAAACGPCVAALGMFDGVHAGHAALIGRAVSEARARGVLAVAVTFRASPLRTLCPDRAPGDIQTLAEKLDSLRALGVDAAVCEEFTAEYARRPGLDFARDLSGKLRAQAVVAGFNYTFGDRGACGARELERMGRELGYEVMIMEPVSIEGGAVSSTRIRERLAQGDIAAVNAMLGRPYELSGTVAHGKHLGHTLGFATANLDLEPGRALPHPGVYVCAMKLEGDWLPGVLNIGSQPTVPSGRLTCEAHALCPLGDVYGRFMRVMFLDFRRPERRFSGIDELRAQVESDKADARAWFEASDALQRLNAASK